MGSSRGRAPAGWSPISGRGASGRCNRTPPYTRSTLIPYPHPHPQSRLFVGRAGQLAELHKRLEQALTGEGQILFVAGEAGSGKTALFRQFAKEAHHRHPELLTLWGQCNAFAGSGDPYLPFRQALGLLAGEARMATKWACSTGQKRNACGRRCPWPSMPCSRMHPT